MPISENCKSDYIHDIHEKLGLVNEYNNTLNELINKIKVEADKYVGGMTKPFGGIDIGETRKFWHYVMTTSNSRPFNFGQALVGLYVNSIIEYYYQKVMISEFSDWGKEKGKKEERDNDLFDQLSDFSKEIHKNVVKPLRDMRNSFMHNYGKAKRKIEIIVRGNSVVFNKGEDIDFSGIDWKQLIADMQLYLLEILDYTKV